MSNLPLPTRLPGICKRALAAIDISYGVDYNHSNKTTPLPANHR